jgi:multicomponent Na+:H+ antiporter subunit D
MVPIALLGAARLYWSVFSGTELEHSLLRPLLVWFGTATAAIGGFVALMQRDVKRLLAMSTFSHMGVILVGIGLLSAQGLAGGMLYVVGHGLTKAGLFLIAGIMLSLLNGIDELQLRGSGKAFPITGAAYALGGLILAGLPIGLMHQGSDLIGAAAASAGYDFLPPILSATAGLTGAGILRGGARIFLGLGPEPGVEAAGPSEQDQEKPNRPIWAMLLPALALISAALALQALPAEEAVRSAAANLVAAGSLPPHLLGHAGWPLLSPPPAAAGDPLEPAIGLSVAVLIAALELGRAHFPRSLTRVSDFVTGPVILALDRIHDGVVTDDVAWLMFGTIVLGGTVVIG